MSTNNKQAEALAEEPVYLPFNVSSVVSIGLYMLVEKIVNESGLLKALTKQFNEYDANLILDIAMFLLTAAHRSADIEVFPLWACNHKIFSSIYDIRYIDKRTGDDLVDIFTDDLEIEQLRYIRESHVKEFKEFWSSVAPRQMRKAEADYAFEHPSKVAHHSVKTSLRRL